MSVIEAAKTGIILISALAFMMVLRKLGLEMTGVGFAVSVLIDQDL